MSAAELAARLPDLDTVREWARALAAVEAVVSPEWESRYFSFDPAWADDEQMASMRNGSGDDWSITFTPAGAYLRAFDHESPLSPYVQHPSRTWPGLLEPVPEGADGAPDGGDLLDELDGDPRTCTAFAADCYETDVDPDAVAHVFAGQPLSEATARALDPRPTGLSWSRSCARSATPSRPEPAAQCRRRAVDRWHAHLWATRVQVLWTTPTGRLRLAS